MVNRVILTGSIAREGQRLYRPDGTAVLEFVLRFDNSMEGPPQTVTEPQGPRGNEIEVVAFGELAQYDLERLALGRRFQVEGRLHQRAWKTPEGKPMTRFEIIATGLKPLETYERSKP